MTQPARQHELNVNLAFAEVELRSPDLRGRVALQAGTSTETSYLREPSQRQLIRVLQEAYLGTCLRRDLWIDAGVFFSHTGVESWISRENPTYTRSLVSEYAPYHLTGARGVWTPHARVAATLSIVNGWQDANENNRGVAVGARIDWMPANRVVVNGYNLISEWPGDRVRTLHGFGARFSNDHMTALISADLGSQTRSNSVGKTAHWFGFTAAGRVVLTSRAALASRFERFDDDEQIVLSTGSVGATPNPPFRGLGASFGADVTLSSRALWRTEVRRFWNSYQVFPGGDAGPTSTNTFAVTALGVSF